MGNWKREVAGSEIDLIMDMEMLVDRYDQGGEETLNDPEYLGDLVALSDKLKAMAERRLSGGSLDEYEFSLQPN